MHIYSERNTERACKHAQRLADTHGKKCIKRRVERRAEKCTQRSTRSHTQTQPQTPRDTQISLLRVTSKHSERRKEGQALRKHPMRRVVRHAHICAGTFVQRRGERCAHRQSSRYAQTHRYGFECVER